MKNIPKLVVHELFLVKADWHRTFMGRIVRENTQDGKELIRGSVTVLDGKIWSVGNSEDEIGKNLDEICMLKLDHKLHNTFGRGTVIAGSAFFLN